VEIDENPFLLAICPSCGKPMKMPKGSKEQEEDKMHCEELSSNPVAIPTGVRTMPDNTFMYLDGNMVSYTQDEYMKNYGFDPDPVWKAIQKWREEQMEKWKTKC
jgi:hypothetical protein